MNTLVKTSVLGIGVTQGDSKSILEYVVSLAEKGTKKCFIATPNPEMVVASEKDKQLRTLLNSADIALCDGVGLFLTAKLMAKDTVERITGVDFMKSLCENVAEKPITVGFLGGQENVAERTAECLQKMYPGLKVVFAGAEWDEEGVVEEQRAKSKEVRGTKSNKIRSSDSGLQKNHHHIDILFVAYGFPKQEQWIVDHLDKIPVTVAMGVGGAFDYLSGNVSRAPFYLRAVGLEWLYRLIRQPWRWKRQLALLSFVRLVIKEQFS